MDYSKLQNGSDIRGVALEGIEGQHVNLTETVCKDIGRGFALWLRKKAGKDDLRVAVGRDSRLSGPQLSAWICDAMVEQGLGMSIMNDLITRNLNNDVVKIPLAPPEFLNFGIAVLSMEKASPVVKRFIKYAVRYLTQAEKQKE